MPTRTGASGGAVVRRLLCVLVVLAATASCGGGDTKAADPIARATIPSGGGASGGLCALFTEREIKDILGADVDAGRAAGPGGVACQWDKLDSDDTTYAQIQVADAEYWEKPSLGAGFQERSGIANEAFVLPEMGGFKAGALTDKSAVYASLAGGTATADSTVEFLKKLLARLPA